jgi:hypothetical protein
VAFYQWSNILIQYGVNEGLGLPHLFFASGVAHEYVKPLWWSTFHAIGRSYRGDPISQLPLEGAVEDGGEEGVQLGGGLGLQPLHCVDLGLQRVQFGDDAALLIEIGDGDRS